MEPKGHQRGELATGTSIGEYEVEFVLGRGAFGTVYAAHQPVIGKRVAIKVLNAELCHDDPAQARFVAEARAVNRIEHPNIVDVFSFGELPDGRSYCVMEYVPGSTLRELLDRHGPLSLADAIEILAPVAEALDAAAEAGVAHRDLKPANVMVSDRDTRGQLTVKLLDFGVAKLVDGPSDLLRTETGAVVGTPSYMSPEQCRGREVDHRSDIYGFGVLLFEMLTGRLPFSGASAFDVMTHHVYSSPPRLNEISDQLPESLAGLTNQLMAKQPEHRPTSLVEVIDMLCRIDQGESFFFPGTESTVDERPPVIAPPATPPKRSTRTPLTLATGLIVGVGLGAIILSGGGRLEAEPMPREAPTPRVPPAEAAPSPGPVTIELNGLPKGALVRTTDGRSLRRGPGEIRLQRSSEPLALVVEAKDHEPRQLSVTPNRDQTLFLELEARASEPAPRHPPPSPAKPRPDDIEPWE